MKTIETIVVVDERICMADTAIDPLFVDTKR